MAKVISEAAVKIKADKTGLQAGVQDAMNMVASTMRGSRHLMLGAFTGIVTGITTAMTTAAIRAATTAVRAASRQIGLAVKESMAFEQSLFQVSLKLSEQSQEVIPDYSKAIRELSKQYGVATATIADGLSKVVDMGFDTGTALDIVRESTRASVATNSDLNDVLRATTVSMRSYKDTIKDIPGLIAKLGVEGTSGDMAEIANGLEDVAFKAKSAGIQLEEVLAFFETMKQKGGSIQDATQVLRGILDPTNRKFKGKTLQESLSYASRLSPKRREEIGLTNFRNLNAVNMAMTDTASIQDNLNSLMSRSADIMDQRLNRSTETLARQWEVFKANVADLRLEFMAWAKESGAIDSVKNAFKDAKSYVEGILSVLKDEGWKAALQKIGADIKEAFKIAIDYIKPYAEEIGQRIAEGFMNGIRNIGSGYGNWSRGQAESGQGVIGKTSRFFQKYLYGPAMNFEYGFRGDESIGNVHRRIDQQWNNRHSR